MGIICCKEERFDLNAEVELQHFNLLRSVGKGAFGKVRVVQHKGSKNIYALKYIDKAKCIQMRAVENIIQERRLLEEIESNFICNMRYAFQDDENLFMKSLVVWHTFIVKILFRDLKPDNILLNETGHAHLTDFNIAVRFRDDKPLTAVAGSMAYMAPEVLSKKGYFSSVDWWSLGVIIFELAIGKRPFRAKTNEGLTYAIMHEDLAFSSHGDCLNPDLIDAIRQFVCRDIRQRMGTKDAGGMEKLRQHPFFSILNWEQVETKTYPAPFVPDSKRANFDATHELEELLLEDRPLKAKPRKKKKKHLENGEPETSVAKDMRIMEEKFTVYDFTKIRKGDSNFKNGMMGDAQDPYEGKDHIIQVTDSMNPATPIQVNLP
ncbi:hypothetical protein BATDEDRAFT_91105 [Batrachochytrium dendrobatidis JAM81]|uniref:Protein kinase domain-containing protein n=1 Tax=Batrachochytrium dendrobatidis (strain JAM81 / FGSC 10211) TaxID=684364 RepID=F4PA83_BATDJ|nr:uncharacterized protein BATDEDRAFT_91105 [Batrachochytrium dendrobatidis JAM81]EGF77992.1 hypothetical protein BATDEDRAFT_91105 [Batrachochytrium dendrobatidis JAM81]|eukprot:XP_006681539.1 hypothetical protein BATDEDRAFT_91105 [Batrachochytrium dendrobatidis JAM81]